MFPRHAYVTFLSLLACVFGRPFLNDFGRTLEGASGRGGILLNSPPHPAGVAGRVGNKISSCIFCRLHSPCDFCKLSATSVDLVQILPILSSLLPRLPLEAFSTTSCQFVFQMGSLRRLLETIFQQFWHAFLEVHF